MQTETPATPPSEQPEQPEQPASPTPTGSAEQAVGATTTPTGSQVMPTTTPTGDEATATPAKAPKPRGIGAAVTFDWALAAQMLITAPFAALGVGPGAQFAGTPVGLRVAAVIGLALAAAITFALGEALRRGWRPVWLFQIVLNSGLILLGLFELPGDISATIHGQHGFFSDLVRASVLLIINPIIVYMLTRPVTRAWIARHTAAEDGEREDDGQPDEAMPGLHIAEGVTRNPGASDGAREHIDDDGVDDQQYAGADKVAGEAMLAVNGGADVGG